MNKARKQLIADFVNANGFASTTELCEKFRASRATIRRDLADLSNAGFLEAYHGGAKAIKRDEEKQARSMVLIKLKTCMRKEEALPAIASIN